MQKHVIIGRTSLVRYSRVGGGYCYELDGKNVTANVTKTILKMQANVNPSKWDEVERDIFDLEFRATL